MTPSRGLDPDSALEISLVGTANRLADQGLEGREIVAQLRSMADGRADLLANAAGLELGGYLAKPGSSHPKKVLVAGYLVLAGADPDRVVAEAEVVRDRTLRTAYSNR